MYYQLAQADPFGTLKHELERQTDPAGFFGTPLAGQALRDDNDNFAFALFEIMPQKEREQLMASLFAQAAQAGQDLPPFLLQDKRMAHVLAAMLLSLQANYMNVSLRQEMTRVFLAKELQEATAPGIHGAHLGSWLSEAIRTLERAVKRTIKSVSDFFRQLGKTIGRGLRQLGDNIHNFRDAMIKLGGPAMRYVTDFLILTPGVTFLFGDLMREVGRAMQTETKVQILPIGAGFSRYLADMSQALSVASNFLPPPWNLVAKAVSVVYKAGSMLIDWQIAEHVQDLLAQQAKANAVARAAMETALRQTFRDMLPEIEAAGEMVPSEHGANTLSHPTGGARQGGMILIGLIGAAAVVVLLMGGK